MTIYSIVLYQCCSLVSPHIVFGVGLVVWRWWCTIVILMQFKLQWFKSDTFAKEKKKCAELTGLKRVFVNKNNLLLKRSKWINIHDGKF